MRSRRDKRFRCSADRSRHSQSLRTGKTPIDNHADFVLRSPDVFGRMESEMGERVMLLSGMTDLLRPLLLFPGFPRPPVLAGIG